eukprot:Rmarinus@m.4064
MRRKDPCSNANFDIFRTELVVLTFVVDFLNKCIDGSVDLHFKCVTDTNANLILDTRDLQISKVEQVTIESTIALEYAFGEHTEALGTPLIVTLPGKGTKEGETFVLRVHYKTTSKSPGLQWLSKEQTAGKKLPYLFSQLQAIHARSMLPCQDTPTIKSPYEAHVTVDPGFVVVMSGIPNDKNPEMVTPGNKQVYHFTQPTPIPSYLIAVAAGDLASRELGPRSRVWCEPSMVDAAAYEFQDTEKYLAAGEEMFGEYRWGRYDILCLPPSFPYGGMENPCLTFVSPTLLAGDQSLVSVIAHEIAHSWSGNLVTMANWEQFWLNEGFTVFLERCIVARVHGKERFDFAAILGLSDLQEAIKTFGEDSPFTALEPQLDGTNPDDAFSSIPYEKGFNFLCYLASLIGGRERFIPFLKAYFDRFAYQSIWTVDFREMFEETFGDISVNWIKWTSTPGHLLETTQFEAAMCEKAKALATSWIQDGVTEVRSRKDIEEWPARQVMLFLDTTLKEGYNLSVNTLQSMGDIYGFNETKNAEILFRWLRLCMTRHHVAVVPSLKDFIAAQGRMKFVRPLYKLWYNSSVGGKETQDFFTTHKTFYHNIAAAMIAKDLGLTS